MSRLVPFVLTVDCNRSESIDFEPELRYVRGRTQYSYQNQTFCSNCPTERYVILSSISEIIWNLIRWKQAGRPLPPGLT